MQYGQLPKVRERERERERERNICNPFWHSRRLWWDGKWEEIFSFVCHFDIRSGLLTYGADQRTLSWKLTSTNSLDLQPVWQDWAILEILFDTVSSLAALIFASDLGYLFWKTLLLSKKCLSYILGNSWEKLFLFISNIFLLYASSMNFIKHLKLQRKYFVSRHKM